MHTLQASIVLTSLTVDTSSTEEMLCTRMTKKIVLLDGALVTENEVDRTMVSSLKFIGLNMDVLPRETLYILYDGVTAELCPRESRTL